MGVNDLYYRGLVEYSDTTTKDKDVVKLNNVIKQANIENDVLETTKLVCTIDEDWVKNIEEGLVYVEKAVREERQFIRTEGEVVPIERAKHTSKTTVEHLAKHSNFITHLPEKPGDNLVPDKLYIVEKESDYAVYENRFLYMMLTYLRDFIAIRLNKIRDMMTTYHGKFAVNKQIDLAHRQIQVEIRLSDQIKDDPILLEKYKSIKIIDRIDMQYRLVLSLLSTPLMEQVSKAPMIKPPITKTNTLKMNTNFKTSLALYDYISAYNGAGYEFTEEPVKLNPFNDETAEDFAKLIALNAFLTYKNANGLSKELKASLQEHEKELKEQEKIQRIEQLKRLKRHVNESAQTMEEYLITLENQNRALDKELGTLNTLKVTIEDLKKNIKELEESKQLLDDQIEELNKSLEAKDLEIESLKESKASELLLMEQTHRQEIIDLHEKFADEIARLNAEHQQNLNNKDAEHAKNIKELNKQHEIATQEAIAVATKTLTDEKEKIAEKHRREVESLTNDVNRYKDNNRDKDAKLNKALDDKKRMINDYEDKIYNLIKQHRENENELNEEIKSLQDEIKELDKRIEHLIQERQFVDAQLHIIRVEQGKTTDEYDYTSKERFEELEAQYKAFKQLFVKEWGKTKKKIREEVFKKTTGELKAEDALEKEKAPKPEPKPKKQKVKKEEEVSLKEKYLGKDEQTDSEPIQENEPEVKEKAPVVEEPLEAKEEAPVVKTLSEEKEEALVDTASSEEQNQNEDTSIEETNNLEEA